MTKSNINFCCKQSTKSDLENWISATLVSAFKALLTKCFAHTMMWYFKARRLTTRWKGNLSCYLAAIILRGKVTRHCDRDSLAPIFLISVTLKHFCNAQFTHLHTTLFGVWSTVTTAYLGARLAFKNLPSNKRYCLQIWRETQVIHDQ